MADQPPHMYGGQAVIEGVMIRGRDHFGLAVRREDGSIELHHEPLSSFYNGRPRKWPLVRGFLTLLETMLRGIKALQLSANMAAITLQKPARFVIHCSALLAHSEGG